MSEEQSVYMTKISSGTGSNDPVLDPDSPLLTSADSGKDDIIRGRDLCENALKTINGARQDQYGNPEDSFELIARHWTAYIDHKFCREFGMDREEFESVELDGQDVAHMMTLLKIARMQGQRHCLDNYVDAIGYLCLAGEM